jgi:curved DNA-binding protein CbpA
MLHESKEPSYYDILDISMNASPETIRAAYIRAKNTYGKDSLAVYTLIDAEESKKILTQIEEAYDVLSDRERRKAYDEAHGFITSPGFDPNNMMSMPSLAPQVATSFAERDARNNITASATPISAVTNSAPVSPIERIQSLQSSGSSSTSTAPLKAAYRANRSYEQDPVMEDRIAKAQNVNGAFLKEVREYKRVTPEEMMDIVKINRNYLNALESDNISKLPAAVFVRGFVLQYAKALQLDSKIVDAYMNYFKNQK